MADDFQAVTVQAKNSVLNVFVQGNLTEVQRKTVFLTVHDVGTNHKSFLAFVNHTSMAEVKEHSVFLHVCVPGQGDNASDFTAEFPTLQQLGEDLVSVLDKFNVKSCVALGEGAGANIVCRFALVAPNRIMALVLLNCTTTTAGFIEHFKDMLVNLSIESGTMTDDAWEYLTHHKFGNNDKNRWYIEEMQRMLNPKNLCKYLYSFSQRTDITTLVGSNLNDIDVLLVAGAKAPHLDEVYQMQERMNKKTTTLLVVDDVSDVMGEAPDHLARSLILLCKGCGLLGVVPVPGMGHQRTLSNSMEEADRPRRLSNSK